MTPHKESDVAETGVRELRNHLSRYLARVRAGEEFTVTDRGRPIARLVPMTESRPFDRLVAEGVIEPSGQRRRTRPSRRIRSDQTVSELVAEQRR